MAAPSLVLASGSPRRRELLGRFGVPFTVAPADVDETVHPGEQAADLVRRLAVDKAQAGLAAVDASEVTVLAADTVVVVDGDVLGKPADDADATAMLRRLSGRTHRVLTGVAVARRTTSAEPGRADRAVGPAVQLAVEVVATEVDVVPLTEADIAWYVATGEPHDKAGAYGIQGPFATFVIGIRGSHDNVVGLSLSVARRLLAQAGADPLAGST
ncbi:Maf family protein [soil metagenome]